MNTANSVDFFDRQFRRQVEQQGFQLNPFELAALPVEAIEADLRHHRIDEDFDCVVSIGLLAFFDCATALRVLAMLQARVRPGGIAVVNVLVEGTSYLDMFQADNYCLFARDELKSRFADWNIIHSEFRDFDAPGQTIKSFATIIAGKPVRPAP